MNRFLGTLLTATLVAGCNPSAMGTTDPPTTPTIPSATPGTGWTLLGDVPAPRAGHAAVYDRARDRMLVFGGNSNDLWAESLSGAAAGTFQRLEAGGSVPPPVAMTAFIDEGKDQLLLFPQNALDRAWMLPLDGSGEWQLVGFGAAPHIELGFALAADFGARRLYAYTSGQPEMWELALDGAGTWHKLAGAPQSGGFACRDTLVFDGGRLLVLSGGWPRGDVFALSLGADPTWTKLNTKQAWFDYEATPVYDAENRRFLVPGLFDPTSLSSFSLDGPSPGWAKLSIKGVAPQGLYQASGIYDAARQRLVAFGGGDSESTNFLHNRTWTLSLGDTLTWSTLGELDDTAPTDDGSALVTVAETGAVLRYGGLAPGGLASATRRFDAATARWQSLGDTSPVTMAYGAGAWDGQRLVSFGGYESPEQDQTWTFDVTKAGWKQIATSGTRPDGRSNHSMIRDPAGDRMLVFGGYRYDANAAGAIYLNDTWAFGIGDQSWSKLDVAGPAPAGRQQHAVAYDEAGQRMFLVGGSDQVTSFADTWVLELATEPRWVPVSATGQAPPAFGATHAAFDPVGRRLLVVGVDGTTPATSADGVTVWALSTGDAPSWQRYCARGTRPARVDGAVWTEDGLFVTAQGSNWRFDLDAATCD
jgi:hypothetical protein